MSRVSKQWIKRYADRPAGAPLPSPTTATAELISELAAAEQLTLVGARLLLERCGYDRELCRRFLHPRLQDLRAPDALPDLNAGIERVVRALEQGETMVVHGDYDVDGVVSVALMVIALREMGGTVLSFIPERELDGYGLSRRSLELCAEKNATLLITCDCGTSALEEVALANERGVDVVITDHHLPGPHLPKALAVINPSRSDSLFPFSGLCGAGVAFYFLTALRARLREQGYFAQRSIIEPDVRAYLDLLTLAIVADSVPIVDENRILVSKGLQVLGNSKRPGLQALLEITGLSGQKLDTWDLAFKLVPRLNCGGRMGRAQLSLDLLLEKDDQNAKRLARELEQLNMQRREIEERVRREAFTQIRGAKSDAAIVVWGENWPKGVIGIVAAKLAEHTQKAAVVIGVEGEQGVGSARGVKGLNLREIMAECAALLERFGGHEGAGGLTIKSANLAAFKKEFLSAAARRTEEKKNFPYLEYDELLDFSQLERELLDDLERFEPFGMGNPEPVFTSNQVEVCEARLVGADDRHMKLRFRQGVAIREAIGFGLGERLGRELPEIGQRLDIAFHSRWNEFRGSKNIQLELKDVK